MNGSAVFIRKNIIDANFADTRHGGGIYTGSANSAVIENNTLVNNIAREWGYGGAIYVNQTGPITIINNIVSANRNALNRTGGIHFVSCPVTVTLSYNNTYNNLGADYAGCIPGDGSISADPMFVDASNQDYHLQPGSPMIDAGDPDPVYNDAEDSGNPGFALYPSMGTVRNDIGAYGGQGGMEPPIPLDSVIIEGPISGEISHTYHFSATVSPISAMDTAEYTWEPAPLSGQGTNNVTYQLALFGEKQIMVTAANAAGSVTDDHTIFIGCKNLLPAVLDSGE